MNFLINNNSSLLILPRKSGMNNKFDPSPPRKIQSIHPHNLRAVAFSLSRDVRLLADEGCSTEETFSLNTSPSLRTPSCAAASWRWLWPWAPAAAASTSLDGPPLTPFLLAFPSFSRDFPKHPNHRTILLCVFFLSTWDENGEDSMKIDDDGGNLEKIWKKFGIFWDARVRW